MADSLASLKPDPNNARRHTPRNVGMIESALREIGAARSIVIDETNTVLAGNATIEAAAAAGIERVQIVDADGETIIAVRRSGLTDAQKTKLALYDNRAAELADWDAEVLAQLADDGADLSAFWFEDELADVLAAAAPPAVALTDPDAVPEPPAEPITKPGDLWLLGEHRVYCGDATKREEVRRVMEHRRADMMFTDPPYGVAYKARNNKATIQGDITQVAIPLSFKHAIEAALSDNARFYLCGGSLNAPMYWSLFDAHCNTQPLLIIWVKESFVMRPNNYHSQFEVIYFGWKGKGGAPEFWYGDRKASDVWQIRRDASAEYLHPTQKPVDIPARAIGYSCPPSGIVYDPFLGSGSTLIACERTGRTCYGMEIDPKYCDVIVRRWEEYTGQTAQRAVTAEAAD